MTPSTDGVVLPELIRRAKSMQKDGYRGPLAWAKSIIDHVASLGADREARRTEDARWISIDDQLPKNGEDVFVFFEGDIQIAGYRRWDEDDHCWAIDGSFYPLRSISHWMPQPAPPAIAARGAEGSANG